MSLGAFWLVVEFRTVSVGLGLFVAVRTRAAPCCVKCLCRVAYSRHYLHDVIPKIGSSIHIATPREKAQATAVDNMHKNLVTIGRAVPEICSRTDRQTDE